jgi:NAD(P)-dependent dehydrogenase (short-subunit alcohol dehydrogenase family)
MASTFCVVGATRGTGLQIASQLLQRGKHVRVVARDPEKARRLLGDRTARVGVRQILIRLGADAVLGHGVALHSTLSRVTISGDEPARVSQVRMDIEVSRGAGCEKSSPTAAKQSKQGVGKSGLARAIQTGNKKTRG